VKISRLDNAYALDETGKRQMVIPVERNRKLLRINLSRLRNCRCEIIVEL